MMLSRLSPVEVLSLGGASPLTSNQVLTAWDQRAMAWMAVVLPLLLGPMRTAGWPRSMRRVSPKRLKFRISR